MRQLVSSVPFTAALNYRSGLAQVPSVNQGDIRSVRRRVSQTKIDRSHAAIKTDFWTLSTTPFRIIRRPLPIHGIGDHQITVNRREGVQDLIGHCG